MLFGVDNIGDGSTKLLGVIAMPRKRPLEFIFMIERITRIRRKMAKVSRAQNVFKLSLEQIYYISKTLTSTEISMARITTSRTSNVSGLDHNLGSFYFP